MLVALATLYRRWRYVEEETEAPPARSAPSSGRRSRTPDQELQELRLAVEREERLLADFRRLRCLSLAREREASLLSLKGRIRALELNLRRAV
jgi:hypothetical protein